MERHASFVSSELGLADDDADPMEVYVVDDPEPWCEDSIACYLGGWVDATIVSSRFSRPVWHELAHHVVARSDIGMTDRFLSEGIAGALGDDWCPLAPNLDWPRPALTDVLGRDDVEGDHYPVGARFVEFVRTEYGTEALTDLARCMRRGDDLDQVRSCVARGLGVSLTELSERFAVARVPTHANPALCSGDAWPLRDGALRLDVTLSCAASTTVNTFEGPDARRTQVMVEVDRPGGRALTWSAEGDVEVEIEPCFCPQGLVPLRQTPEHGQVFFAEPGAYRVVLRTSDPDVETVALELGARQ